MTAVADTSPAAAATSGEPATLPAWLLQHAEQRPKAVALRVKELGRWRELTWADYAAHVATVGRALQFMGVQAGDRVAILSDNRPEWLVIDLAVQGLGATTVGLYVTATPAELSAQLQRADVKVAIVEDEEQFDKLVEVQPQVGLRHLVVIDPRGIQRLDDPSSSYEALESLGSVEAILARNGDLSSWEKVARDVAGDAVATIVYTPGTTGEPKGVVLTHTNLVVAATAAATAIGLGPHDEIVSTLPLCEIAERSLTLAQAVRVGATVNFGEGGDSLGNDLREVQPTVVLGAPRVWERLHDRAVGGIQVAGRVKRGAVHAAQRAGGAPGNLLVKRPLRKRLGLGRARVLLSATAPTPGDILEWWRSVGVPLRQAYGLSEAGGFVAVTPANATTSGAVGPALDGVELHIDGDDRGEVLVRGASIFRGYLGASDRALDADGWFHTGDVGTLDAHGNLSIVDRSKDVVITSSGHRVVPRPIEERLTDSPYVQTAVLVGDGRPAIGALLEISGPAVSEWAGSHNVPFTTYRTLTERPEVRELLQGVVDDVNRSIDELDQVRCFALLPEELNLEDGTVTATFKVRRGPLIERYRALIDSMYSDMEDPAR